MLQNRRMARHKSPPQPKHDSPDAVEAAFYAALREGDLESLMACWATHGELACIHPGSERLHGHSAIRASFEALFADGGHVPVTPEHVLRLGAGDSAVHLVQERVDGMTARGPIRAYVQATNAYQRTDHGWRMVLHHASPGMAKLPAEATGTPQILH